MIDFVTWPPFSHHRFIINKGGQVTKPIIVVKICYKLLYIIQVVKKRFLISNFLASTDIKVFGHTYLFAMLLLIGLTLFYTQGVFVQHVFLQPSFEVEPKIVGDGFTKCWSVNFYACNY